MSLTFPAWQKQKILMDKIENFMQENKVLAKHNSPDVWDLIAPENGSDSYEAVHL